jgi:hypothetical protein
LFTNQIFREKVSIALISQTIHSGLVLSNPKLNYCLVSGKTASDKDRREITESFNLRGWIFRDEYWVKNKLIELSDLGYEDDVAVIVAKLFTR